MQQFVRLNRNEANLAQSPLWFYWQRDRRDARLIKRLRGGRL